MEIKEFTIADLKKAIILDNLWDTEIVPISKQRAISQVNNPRATEDDIVLLVGYEDNRVIGYLGILPDTIFIDNKKHKIGWFSGWWVEPAQMNTGIGVLLLFKALHHYNQSIAVLGLSDSAKKVYEASRKFITIKKLEVMIILFRLNSSYFLPRKIPKLKKFLQTLKFLDFVVNSIMNFRLFIWKRINNIHKNIKFEYINEIDEETKQFMAKYNKDELTRRSSVELNWIIKYPWILSSPLKDKISSGYYFSSESERYLYMNVKVFSSNDEMIGFIMFKLRDHHLEVPYLYYCSKHIKQILYVIGYHMIEMDVSIFMTHNEDLIRNFADIKFPYLYKRKTPSPSFISRRFKGINFENYHLQDGDGDRVF